jgi:hypothetical protein
LVRIVISFITGDPTTFNTETTEWDVTRFVDKSKRKKGKQSESDIPVNKVELIPLREPATILDQHGRVLAWALPGILHPNQLVRWKM